MLNRNQNIQNMIHKVTIRLKLLFRGTWHGQVAIKMLHMDPDSDNNQAQLSAFKLEVSGQTTGKTFTKISYM